MIADASSIRSVPAALELSASGRVPSLSEAAGEFESYLVGELLRTATRSPAGPGPLDGGEAGRMYRELFYAELGRSAAQAGVFGLAKSMEAQTGSESKGEEDEA